MNAYKTMQLVLSFKINADFADVEQNLHIPSIDQDRCHQRNERHDYLGRSVAFQILTSELRMLKIGSR